MNNPETAFRALPSVDRMLQEPKLVAFQRELAREVVLGMVRQVLEETRQAIAAGQPAPSGEVLIATVGERLAALMEASLRPVINATGVILHTNLGRAPLSEEALRAMEQVARGYSNLEFDLMSGERGSRQAHVEGLLCQLTGAEAALAVNNNAAGLFLALSALLKGKGVLVSRGQAVEIGGGFRIPEVLRASGARLVEVGTTNRTYIADYEQAISPRVGAILRVHSSNFRIVGFTHETSLLEMVELARRTGLLVLDDLGSGCLLDTRDFGLGTEPMVQESVAQGSDLVFFSGDKLLGGPQAGLIVGRRSLIERLRRHPIARAVRIDKLSLAGLEATLVHYVKGEAPTRIPVWRMIAASGEESRGRAQAWSKALGGLGELVEGRSTVGGGSLPGETLPTTLLALRPSKDKEGPASLTVVELSHRLRRNDPPILGRIERSTLLLDPRTVFPEQDEALMWGLRRALGLENR